MTDRSTKEAGPITPVVVVGLEVHVQLATQSKLFCGCSTAYGGEPNTQTCPVCIGMPGALPVINREAVRLALRTGLALGCRIDPRTKWDRKQYFYPDLPKGYQISQYDMPIASAGCLEISDAKGRFAARRIRVARAHLEEDAGKSVHAAADGASMIDLNRAGTPLLEIVSEPDLRGAAEARAYLSELKLVLTYLGVSDCNMQEGSLRVDANVNLHLEPDSGPVATPIVEVKNMNSFRAVERAIDYEAERQYRAWREGGAVLGQAPKQTRGWDDGAGRTVAQREKEESSDYRYFPDPDLPPLELTDEQIEAERRSLGRLPGPLRRELHQRHGLSLYDADVLVSQGIAVVDYFLAVARQSGDSKAAAKWVSQHVLRAIKTTDQSGPTGFPLSAERLAMLIRGVASGDVPKPRSREVFQQMASDDLPPAEAMARLGIAGVDTADVEALADELLAANPRVVADLRRGKQQAVGALIGQAKRRNANIDPGLFRQLCLDRVDKAP